MTKNRAYKFHEIIEHLEIKHIAVGTKLVSDGEGRVLQVVSSSGQGLYLRDLSGSVIMISPSLINDIWRVEKEVMFYLKAPETFVRKYLIEYVDPRTQKAYRDFVYNPDDTNKRGRTTFTKQEVEEFSISYGDGFFIPEEVKDND